MTELFREEGGAPSKRLLWWFSAGIKAAAISLPILAIGYLGGGYWLQLVGHALLAGGMIAIAVTLYVAEGGEG